ncbi:hypothetical protein PM082_016817 [Marasmius tenuissimus]|nr:hypothetical protein PM082_016817 [Marasmius tenuissimus]
MMLKKTTGGGGYKQSALLMNGQMINESPKIRSMLRLTTSKVAACTSIRASQSLEGLNLAHRDHVLFD